MNVFVLNTGRCGSMTFAKACSHITNFSSGHETRAHRLGPGRLRYPGNHIEVDNRLSWMLGRLDDIFGDSAIYVHLHRRRADVMRSYIKRADRGIMRAYGSVITIPKIRGSTINAESCARDMLYTMEKNIQLFLRDKTRVMHVSLENAADDFPKFWKLIGAKGDLSAAVSEFSVRYNRTIKRR